MIYKCEICGRETENKQSHCAHMSHHKGRANRNVKYFINPATCTHCGVVFKTGRKLLGHINFCEKNQTAKGKELVANLLKYKPVPTPDSGAAISRGMIKAHASGRAFHINRNRVLGIPSYPEKFFMEVFNNNNIKFQREVRVGKYSLDFLIGNIVVEVDGDQHIRFANYAASDKIKDELLLSMGYKVIRILWKKLYNETKPIIAELLELLSGKKDFQYVKFY